MKIKKRDMHEGQSVLSLFDPDTQIVSGNVVHGYKDNVVGTFCVIKSKDQVMATYFDDRTFEPKRGLCHKYLMTRKWFNETKAECTTFYHPF